MIGPLVKRLRFITPSVKGLSGGMKVISRVLRPDSTKVFPYIRRNHAGNQDDPKYEFWYPLIEWGWDRERCKEEIRAAGLPCFG
jgi:hypothetical protein